MIIRSVIVGSLSMESVITVLYDFSVLMDMVLAHKLGEYKLAIILSCKSRRQLSMTSFAQNYFRSEIHP